MVGDPVGIGQLGPVAALEHQPARRGLFVGAPDRALMRVPGVAIAGVEQVIDLAGEIGLPARIKGGGVVTADQLVGTDLRGGEVGAEGLGGGREEVGLVPAHFVQVDDDHRVPLPNRGDLAAGLGLREGEPVAIEVEHVVVHPPARPRLVMLGRLPVGIGCDAGGGEEIVHEARPPVGVLHRVDDHDGAGHDLGGTRIVLRGEQVIGSHQRGVGRGDLVAVDAIGEPCHGHRHAVAGSSCSDCRHISANRVDLRHVGGGRKHQIVKRTAFPAHRILHEPRAIRRGFGECLQVGIGLIGRGDPRARRMADGGGQRRDRGIELPLGKGLRGGRRGEGKHRQEQEAPAPD